MSIKIIRLGSLADLADLVTEVNTYFSANPSIARTKVLALTANGTDYTGTYNRFTKQDVTYEIISPLPSAASGDLFDVETSWVQDANGTLAFQVEIVNTSGAVTIQHFDQPGGTDITGTLTAPLTPASAAAADVVFDELARRVLPITDASAVGLAQCEDPANPGANQPTN